MPNSLWCHGLQPTRFLCPWDFPGKDTGVVCHFLLQGIFPTQPGSLHCTADRFFTNWATREAQRSLKSTCIPWMDFPSTSLKIPVFLSLEPNTASIIEHQLESWFGLRGQEEAKKTPLTTRIPGPQQDAHVWGVWDRDRSQWGRRWPPWSVCSVTAIRGSLPFSLCVCLYSSSLHLALHRHFCFSSVCLCFPLSFSICPSGLPSWRLSCVCLYVCTPVCLYLHLSVFVHVSLSLCECLPVHTFLRMKVPAQHFELTDFTNVNGTLFWATLSPVLSSQPQGLPRLQGQVEFFSMTHQALCNLSPSGGPAPYSASPHGWHTLA